MKYSKLLLATMGATVLLGALVSSASARALSYSSQNFRATWNRMNFSGGIGTVECEVLLQGSLHSRSNAKLVGTLIGYISEGTVIRCSRGGATLLAASLPWHRRYRGFVGTLPNISSVSETVTGAEWTLREPTFGVTCTIRRESFVGILTLTLTGGAVHRADISGTFPCSGFTIAMSGATTVVSNGAGASITVTLI